MVAYSKSEARRQASSAINKWALGFAAIAWVPGSHYAMGAGDIAMIRQVGAIFDVSVSKTAAAEIFTIVAAPLIGSKVAHSILDFIPVVGWGVKSAVAAGVTKAVGEALISYFDDCSPLP
ncbi:MAG: hypothetical protein O4750_08080 [Trichodesmium sp. St18_bin3_1_1]|nr:hypothetical protein [Trichodesmium sp. St18_bin3_1_1]